MKRSDTKISLFAPEQSTDKVGDILNTDSNTGTAKRLCANFSMRRYLVTKRWATENGLALESVLISVIASQMNGNSDAGMLNNWRNIDIKVEGVSGGSSENVKVFLSLTNMGDSNSNSDDELHPACLDIF